MRPAIYDVLYKKAILHIKDTKAGKAKVLLNGRPWKNYKGNWVVLKQKKLDTEMKQDQVVIDK